METAQKVALLAAVAGGAYLGYKYVYLPHKMRELIAQQAMQRGLAPHDYLQGIGALACQSLGVSQGVPAQMSGNICNEMGGAVAELIRSFPGAIGSIGQGTGTAVAGLGSGVASAGTSLVGLGYNVLGLAKAVALLPVDVATGAVREVGGVVADGAKGVAKGIGAVGSGIGHGAAAVFHALTPW